MVIMGIMVIIGIVVITDGMEAVGGGAGVDTSIPGITGLVGLPIAVVVSKEY